MTAAAHIAAVRARAHRAARALAARAVRFLELVAAITVSLILAGIFLFLLLGAASDPLHAQPVSTPAPKPRAGVSV